MPIINEIHVYADGCCRGNPGASAIGFSIYDEHGNLICEHKQCIGEATNNKAEYMAIIRALEIATGHCRRKAFVYSDSEVVVRQINGTNRIKVPHLLELFHLVKDRERAFDSVVYTHIRREHPKIQRVNSLANEALDVNGFHR